MSLATRDKSNGTALIARSNNLGFTVEDVWQMAESVHQSKLFPNVTSPQAAFTLMLLCQADGLHPIQAIRMYDIIEGRPALKSAAIQAKFQEAGGVIEIIKLEPAEVRARFSHPVCQPVPFEASFTIKDAERAKLTGRKNWIENPTDMLWWRLVSKMVRKIMPGIVVGIYSVEEAEDMRAKSITAEAAREVEKATVTAAVTEAEIEVVGYTGNGVDDRNYKRVVDEAIVAANAGIKTSTAAALGAESAKWTVVASSNDLHNWIFSRAVNTGLIDGQRPAKQSEAIKALDAVYRRDRGFVRSEIGRFMEDLSGRVESAIEEGREAAIEAARDKREPIPAGEGLPLKDEPKHERQPGEEG